MKPVDFPVANKVFRVPEDVDGHDLPTFAHHKDNAPCITSIWEMDAEEMAALVSGKLYVSLTIFGNKHPCVSMALINEKLIDENS